MNVIASKSRIRFGLRPVGLLVVFLAAMSLLSCFGSVEHVVILVATGGKPYEPKQYLYGKSPHVVTQDELDERLPIPGEIIKRNDTKRMLRITDGVQTADVKVMPLGESKSRVTIVASLPKGEELKREREEELAMSMMKGLCEEAKTGCKFIKE